VSFNLSAFESYGAKQGDNAQVSEATTFAYATALNTLLAKGSKNRVQIGDASTVFWADVSGAPATMVENLFSAMMQGSDQKAHGADQRAQDRRIGDMLELLRRGRADALDPGLTGGVRLHVLGLAPNAARLSVRFWLSDSFGRIAENYARYAQDMAIEPAPNPPLPGFWSLLRVLAVQGKPENVPPNLAGEWLRAVLTGGRYPQTLLGAAVTRARVEKDVGARRASIIRAVLRRNENWEAPVSLDYDNPSQAYQLGRLFAVLEQAQRAALGKRINATIADRYYASASSTPARVFGPLLRGLRVHVSDARKRNLGGWITPKVEEIMLKLGPDLPTSLTLDDQARFAIGYYHEKATPHGKPKEIMTNAQDEQEEHVDD
jgi:CRISPR-associated protein Csd1